MPCIERMRKITFVIQRRNGDKQAHLEIHTLNILNVAEKHHSDHNKKKNLHFFLYIKNIAIKLAPIIERNY